MNAWADPTHHPKRHPDPFSILPQYTFGTDRQTDTQTDIWARRQVSNMSASFVILTESDALIKENYIL